MFIFPVSLILSFSTNNLCLNFNVYFFGKFDFELIVKCWIIDLYFVGSLPVGAWAVSM